MEELKLEKLKSILNKDEIRRLEKAAREKNKVKLADWAKQFEEQISQYYEKYFQEELGKSIDNFILTIIYVLHFNELTKFGSKRIDNFMADLLETIDMFRRGEAMPDDYREQLKKDGIIVKGNKD